MYKGMKIKLVRDWLENGSKKMILGNRKVRVIAERYQTKSRNNLGALKSHNAIENTPSYTGKLDDLSDSLLQGLAWLEWEENKKILASQGPEGLLCQ